MAETGDYGEMVANREQMDEGLKQMRRITGMVGKSRGTREENSVERRSHHFGLHTSWVSGCRVASYHQPKVSK